MDIENENNSWAFPLYTVSDVVRIDRRIAIFYLSKLWKSKFFILCGAYISAEAAGEIWNIDHTWEWKG